jgi:hypothetical protein
MVTVMHATDAFHIQLRGPPPLGSVPASTILAKSNIPLCARNSDVICVVQCLLQQYWLEVISLAMFKRSAFWLTCGSLYNHVASVVVVVVIR